MLSAFKIKAFDLEPVYAEWANPPLFRGNAKKDPAVDDWLDQVKAGCIERKVPREYWHKVAQHFLAERAKARFDELKLVMKNMHGGKYRWTWKNFKIAMRNMGWDIDPQKTQSIEVESRPSGFWRIIRMGSESGDSKDAAPAPAQATPPRPPPKSRATFDFGATMKSLPAIPTPRRSTTTDSVETVSSISSSGSSSAFSSFFSSAKSTPASTPAASTVATPAGTPGGSVTTVTQVPAWLVSACQSLEFLTNEHPKVMTAVSAVLITVGSLPALPAVAAGAGGAFLASSTAHALGSLAVGLGTLLQAQADGKMQVVPGEANKS